MLLYRPWLLRYVSHLIVYILRNGLMKALHKFPTQLQKLSPV